MSTIRVATLDEMPPGKGKVLEVAGRVYTVYNRSGRIVATSAPSAGRQPPPVADSRSACPPRGVHFDVWTEDSPARLHDEEPASVELHEDAVWLVLP